jgi:D-alanyl-lipoteichoic acid acyltransferase DltB (MBOAT superfamily)
MAVCSPLFFALLWGLAAIFSFAPGRTERRVLISLTNVRFLSTFVANWQSGLAFALFLGATYGLLELDQRRPGAIRPGILIAIVVAGFVMVKKYWFVEWLIPPGSLHGIELVGLSYMLFKFIHMLVDQSQGQLARRDLASYVNYQLGFFTLLAGPIQRYNDFQESWDAEAVAPPASRDALLNWLRIVGGMLKMGAVAFVFSHFIPSAQAHELAATRADAVQDFAAHFYLYPLYLYFNFSGYTDVAIGGAGLLGYRLPENFNRPFRARNVVDFWDRWHISLTRWIRDYVFMTSYKWIAERWPGRSKPAGIGIIFLSLVIAGAWHGATAGFIAFGLLHGVGAAATRAYGDALTARLGRAGLHRYLASRWIEYAAMSATFHFVCLTFLFFALGVDGTLRLVRTSWAALAGRTMAVTALEIGLAVLVMFVVVALLFAWLDWLERSLGHLRLLGRQLTQTPASLSAVVIAETALLMLLFIGLWAFAQEDPIVVYMKF